jgi:hypothetical protein
MYLVRISYVYDGVGPEWYGNLCRRSLKYLKFQGTRFQNYCVLVTHYVPLAVCVDDVSQFPSTSSTSRQHQSLLKQRGEMSCALIASLLLVLAACSEARYRKALPGPWVTPTKGEPWPKPQQIVNYEGYVVVRPTVFTFEVWNVTCNWMIR